MPSRQDTYKHINIRTCTHTQTNYLPWQWTRRRELLSLNLQTLQINKEAFLEAGEHVGGQVACSSDTESDRKSVLQGIKKYRPFLTSNEPYTLINEQYISK